MFFFFFKQKTAYELRISDWSSDVCSSDLKADVNQFQAAGGPGFIIRELIDDGLMDPEVITVAAGGLREYGKVPQLEHNHLVWKELPAESGDETVRSEERSVGQGCESTCRSR